MSENNMTEDSMFAGGLFSGINLDEVPDNPFYLPPNTYKCEVVGVKIARTNAGDKVGMTIKYQVIEGTESNAMPFQEWLEVFEPATADLEDPVVRRSFATLKMRAVAFGFSASEIATVKPKDFEGRIAWVTTDMGKDKKNNQDQIRVKKVESEEEVRNRNEGSDEGMSIFES